MQRTSLIFIAAIIIAGSFIFALPAPASAVSATPSEQEQLAALASQVQMLRRLFDALKQNLARPASAVAQCADGIDNDGDGQIDYPADTGCYGADDNDEAYYATSGTTTSTTSSSCSQSLITLLGTGCHYMYNDSSGRSIYCNSEMTRSAKEGDTAVTTGCSSGGSYTYTSTTTTTTTTTTSTSCGTGYYWYVPSTGSGYCKPNETTTTTTGSSSANLTATVSGSDVTLTWTDFYQGEGEYRIERKVGTGAWVQIGTSAYLAGGNGTYRDVGVTNGTYDYHVKPCTSASGCFGESNIARATVGGSSTSTTAPATATPAPVISSVAATNVTSNSATVGWITDIPANSKVEYGIGTASSVVSDGAFTTSHSISLSGLTSSTTYTYNVVSENTDYYRTTFSNQKFSTLSSASTFSLVAPTGLSARTDTNGYDVVLAWTDNSYEEEYKIERRRTQESWVTIASIPAQANSGTYTDRSIPSGLYGTYEYRVKACGGGACSPDSNIATVNVTGGTSSSTCDSALSALLGTGCHFMHNDSAGNPIYCDGPMTKSAKRGDTATTAGCPTSPGTTGTWQCSDGRDNDGDGQIDYPADTGCYSREDNDETSGTGGGAANCSAIASQSTCSVTSGCQWNAPSAPSGAAPYCSMVYAGDTTSCPGFSYSRWDSTGKRYCQLNNYAACQYNYPTYLDVTAYLPSNCPAAGQMQCSDGKDNDFDGAIDYPKDTSCYGPEDNDEYYPPGQTATTTPTAPAISSLSPFSGPIGTKVVITGTGFTPTGNQVNFDTGVIIDLSSADGKTLSFAVPDDRVPLCAVTEPRCLLPAPYNPVKPGTYWVSVTNANGTSGGVSFGVTESVAAVFTVDPAATSPKSGVIGVDAATRIRVKFTREFDPSSTVKEFFRLYKTSVPDARVSGSFSIFSDGFEFLPSGELEPSTGYTYTVLSTIRDRSGATLSPYSASFATGVSTRGSGTLVGKVTDAAGAPVVKAIVRVFPPYTPYQSTAAYSPLVYFSRDTQTDSSGSFQFSVPPGAYMVTVYPPAERSDLTRVAPREVAVGAGETRTVNFALGGAVKIITGTVAFSNGKSVTDAEVGAYASETRQWTSAPTDASGSYTLKVSGGAWLVGIHPRDSRGDVWSWNEKPRSVTFSRDQISETKTLDFTVPLRDATLSVSAVDEAGAAFGNVGIIVDTHSASSASTLFSAPSEFRITGSDGKAKFTLRAGTYYVRAYLPPNRGYFNPDEQIVTLVGGQTQEVKIVFKKRQVATALTITGVTKIDEGVLVDAFVWAWSERGGFASTRADQGGRFSFNVTPNERWHVGAGKEYKSFPYKSPDLVVEVKTQSVTIELLLTKQSLAPLSPTVNVTQAAAQQVVAQATDGAQITLPPEGAASSGTVQVEIKPTVEAPSQAGTEVVSTVYDVTIHDSAGNPVTTLSKEAEIVIPYSEAELKEQGVSEDAIVPSYFDEKSGTWVNLDGCTIDKERNAAICRVDHLTRFAITARADTTPPDAPSAVVAKAAGGGKITLTWKNPTKDFDYAKVYRSLKAGELGTIRAASLRTTQFIDSEGLTDGVTYYYTVRAIDPAGNESANTVQVNVAAKGTSGAAAAAAAAPNRAISRTLREGMRGEDVKMLQQFLIKEKYLSGQATGFFGKATKEAVIRLQEKYASELLTPVGLKKGSGIVGPSTRQKVNALLK